MANHKGIGGKIAGTLGMGFFLAASALLAAILLPLGSCTFETTIVRPDSAATQNPIGTVNPSDTLGSGHNLAYVVSSDSGSAGCRVKVQINAWPAGEAVIFQAPVYYTDNPVMPAPGYKAAAMTVTDKDGNPLQARDTLIAGLNLDGNFIVLPATARTISYPVDLAPKDAARFGLPVPGTAAGVDLIDGAYYFILPLLGRDFATQWRTPAQFSLEFTPIPGRTLVGIDAKRNFASNYELMFVRAAYDPVRSKTFSVRNHEVTVYATSASAFDMDAFGGLLERCIGLVEDSLMPLPTVRYFAGENPEFWGIESVQGYWFKTEAAVLPEVHIHEITHTFVGVYHSDYDDPWWKEGVTNYLGQLLSLQNGLTGDTAFAASMLLVRDSLPSVKQYALSNHYVRNHLFTPLDSAFVQLPDPLDFNGLVYGKGSQAAMILDRYILEGSGGKKSIFDLIRDLVQSYGTAFHRSDLEASVDKLAGGSSSAFLRSLLDETTPLGADSLVHTYTALRTLKRFGPGGGLHPVPGVDPAPAAKAASGYGTLPRTDPAAPSVTRKIPGGVPAGFKL